MCHLDELLEQYPDPEYDDFLSFCDCDCSDILPNAVERPSTVTMILSFAAQSMVAAIVALNLGFRKDNVELWRKFAEAASSLHRWRRATVSNGIRT